MTPVDALVILTAFVGILALGAVVADLLLTTSAHRDARRRADLGDKWWRA